MSNSLTVADRYGDKLVITPAAVCNVVEFKCLGVDDCCFVYVKYKDIPQIITFLQQALKDAGQ